MSGSEGFAYLSKHEVPLGELHKHLLCTQSIVKLLLEIINLNLRVSEFNQRLLVLL